MARPLHLHLLCVALALLAPLAPEARELSEEGAVSLRTSLKSTLVVGRADRDPLLPGEPAAADAFFRLRLDLVAKPVERLTAGTSWETRLRATAPSNAASGGLLPAEAPPPWRLRALDGGLADAPGLAWRQELDRAFVGFRAGAAELTVGRQAIGWGRGVLFGAVDLFSPFSPLEVDRAWRRGVDALRADVRLGERLSADAVAALGRDADTDASIFAARARGYVGKVDGELLLGRRARDLFAGLTSSAAVGDAELHAEVALFRTPDANPDPLFASDRLVAKATLGASYRFAVGSGLPVFAEYHYTGFGAARPGDLPGLMADPAYAVRLARGDTQLACRHALALLATYEANEEASFQLLWLASPRDGSGVVAPTATLTLGDRTAVQATAYLPIGAGPRGGIPRSDLGATPLAVMVQVAVYD